MQSQLTSSLLETSEDDEAKKKADEKLSKKLGTSTPNIDLMTIGFILKLKEFNCLPSSYSYLLTFVSPENKEKFNM